MIIFNLFLSGSPFELKILFSTVLFIFMFYALGKIIQNNFNIKKNFSSLAFPIGFFSYVIITQIFYFIFLLDFLSLSNDVLIFIEVIKNLFLWLLIISFYKMWIPKVNSSKFEIISLSIDIFIVLFTILLFFILEEYAYPANITSGGYHESLLKIGTQDNYDLTIFVPGEGGFFQAIVQYETFYYWISTFGTLISTSETYIEATGFVSKYVGPLFILISVSLTSIHTFSKNNHLSSKSLSLLFSILFAFVLVLVGPLSNEFYTCGLLMVMCTLLLAYSFDAYPDNSYIYLTICISISSVSFTLWSSYVILFMGVVLIILTVIRSGNIIRNLIHFLLTFLSIQIIFWVISFLEYPQAFDTIVIYLILVLITSFIFLVPLYSLYFSQSRRKDLNSFERKTSDKSDYWIWISSSIILLIIITFNLLVKNNEIFNNIRYFFEEIIHNTSFLASFILYILVIIIPIIFIYIASFLGYKNIFLKLFVFMNVIFNPFLLSEIFISLEIDINWYILYVPSIFIILAWISSIILKFLPKTIRL